MFRTIIASIAMHSIVFFSVGQIAFALPLANLRENNRTEVKSCAGCSAAATNPLDRLATLGQQSQVNPLLPVKHSLFKGLPIGFVSSSTGELSFAMSDLAFEDNPLLLFQRTYNSSRNEDFGLGRGWSYTFNESITLNGDNAVLTNAVGDNYAYQRTDAKNFVLQNSEAADVEKFEKKNGNTISAENGDITRIYKRSGNTFYLNEVTAPNGWEVSINRNSKGNITDISSISGEINFNWSNGSNAKLLTVTDSAGRRIAFEQSNGLLQSATTATGGVWQYEYTNGRLTRSIDSANRIALRAKYNASGRASEFGDAVGINRIVYKLNSDDISTTTTVTDSLNYARAFRQNERGMTTIVTDQKGTLLNLLYNQDNRIVQITDANGATATLNYDAEQRLTRQLSSNGDEKTFEYNKKGKLSVITDNKERTEIVYDENDRLMQTIGKNSRSKFDLDGHKASQQINGSSEATLEYDSKGHITAVVISDVKQFERTFDAAGRKTSEKLSSGDTENFDYNSNNQIVRRSDNRGNTKRIERDASGNIQKLVNQDNDWIQVIRDEAGRIVQLKNSFGQSRFYKYNSRGALTEFIGADGKDLQFQYDERGEFLGVIDAQNISFNYRQTRFGNFAKIQKPSVSQKNSWQIQKIKYAVAVPSAAVEENCLLDDGFYTFGNDGNFIPTDCSDPFGGVSEGGGNRGGSGGGSGGSNCYNRTNCVLKAALCIGGVVTWVVDWLGIITCPETLGIGCILALIAHPFTGYGTATACAAAATECQKPVCLN